MSRLPPDEDARRRAATRFDRNLVVTAGAGTGKTALLVERFLNLLLSGAADLDGIVAITFTEKATNEMRSRVAAGLDAILGRGITGETPVEVERSLAWLRGEAGVPEPLLAERARSARAGLTAASISTIHSFAAELLRRHPREAGLPLDVTVDEGADLDVLLEELWPEFLGRELGNDALAPEAWRRILNRHSQSDLEALARSLVRNPVAADLLVREGYRPLDPREAFGAEIRGYLERFPGYVAALTGRSDNMRALLETALLCARCFLEQGTGGLRAAPVSAFPLEDFWERTTMF
jgi:ATP-dependent exoDNAse (exonuclease V) beta subunit